jgi:hypothetical protein
VPKLSDDPERIKVVHTYGVGLHPDDPAPDDDDPRSASGGASRARSG